MTTPIFDIAALDTSTLAEKGAALNLRHPGTYEELGVKIWLQGADANSYRAVVRRQIDEQIAQSKADLTAVELEDRHIERLVAVTKEWENVTYHGAALELSHSNAEKLYREQIWIREQVTQFVEGRSHFLPA